MDDALAAVKTEAEQLLAAAINTSPETRYRIARRCFTALSPLFERLLADPELPKGTAARILALCDDVRWSAQGALNEIKALLAPSGSVGSANRGAPDGE